MHVLLDIWQYVLVFLLGAIPWIEIAAVIPLSIVAGMNPFLVGIFAFLGNLSTVYLVIIFFERFRQWRSRKRGEERPKSKRQARAVSIWNKYGLPGLSLLGPLLLGSHIAVFLGILFGAKKHTTLLWMTISLALWTVIITILSVYGIDFIRAIKS